MLLHQLTSLSVVGLAFSMLSDVSSALGTVERSHPCQRSDECMRHHSCVEGYSGLTCQRSFCKKLGSTCGGYRGSCCLEDGQTILCMRTKAYERKRCMNYDEFPEDTHRILAYVNSWPQIKKSMPFHRKYPKTDIRESGTVV